MLAVIKESTRATQFERLSPGERRHGPTVAYRLDNALLGGGTLYYDDGFEVIRGGPARSLLPRNADNFTEMQLCTNYVIEHFFGHWLTDGLCLELLAEQRALPALTLSRIPWLHEPGYRELSGLNAVRSRCARVDRLWIVDDRGRNDGWISRTTEVRRRVRSKLGRSGPKYVMLARGTLGTKRNLVNTVEVQEALGLLGFEIVNPKSETPEAIGEKLSGTEIAICVEGSTQSHSCLAMPSGSTLIAIQPPTRFNSDAKERTDALGMNWAYVVAEAHSDGFHLPIDRLLRTIDEVVRVAGVRQR